MDLGPHQDNPEAIATIRSYGGSFYQKGEISPLKIYGKTYKDFYIEVTGEKLL